jgi:pimeloyl-ACP methyl ester carboxylesterase
MKTILLIITLTVLLSLWGFYSGIRPFRITSAIKPSDLHLTYEDVSFRTDDNVLIRGWFIPNKNPKAKTIILLHGYPADKSNILPAMAFLHDRYHLLLFDFRFLGQSEGYYSTAGKNEVLDLLAAIRYLKTRGIQTVGVWGFSLGGAVALMAAPKAPEIKAIVAESSYARLDWVAQEYYRLPLLNYVLAELTRWWGLLFLGFDLNHVSPAESAKHLTIPILLIHSESDAVVPFRHGMELQKSIEQNKKARIIFDEKMSHGEFIQDHNRIIEDFFEKNL